MREDTLIVGVAGASGSGKTTLCRALAERLGADCVVLEMDRYYRDLSHLSPADRETVDYDRPDALDLALLVEHLGELAAGHAAAVPVYDFATHTRRPVGEILPPARVVLVEGLFCLAHDALRECFDVSVFVDACASVCLDRRVARDVAARGRTADQVREQYASTVLPAAQRYVWPSARFAGVTVDGMRPVEQLCDEVERAIAHRSVLAAAPGGDVDARVRAAR